MTRSGAVSGGRNQIDVDRDGGRCGNDWCCCLREEGLGRRPKGAPFDPRKLLSGGIEDSNTRQHHRFGEHVDDEKFVFHVVLAVVGADNLGLVNRTDDDCSRSVALRGRSG